MRAGTEGTGGLLVNLGGCLFIALVVMLGTVVITYQIFLWLRRGEWFGISVIDGVKYIDNILDPEKPWRWIWNPDDWIGLYRVFDMTPLSLFLILLGFVVWWLLVFAGIVVDNMANKQ